MNRVQVLWPGGQVPVSVIVDDPTPCRNPAWYEFPEHGHTAVVPNSFLERFADLMDAAGAAGKFSVIPCPGAQGRIDEGIPGVPAEELSEFVRIVRERIEPRWSLSPELLTHNKALDLETMRPLTQREDEWIAQQDEATLYTYISLALRMLRNVGLEPDGVTSPWLAGLENEEVYTRAIARALRDVCGVKVGWYFVHSDWQSPYVAPQVVQLDGDEGTALVSLVAGTELDYFWWTQRGDPADIDMLLTGDGKGGRLAELYSNGSPVVFFTHWQSLFSNGSGAGLDALYEVCRRINRHWGGGVRWMSASELARHAAAREATRFELDEAGRKLAILAPIACPDFTFTLPAPPETTSICLDGRELERTEDADAPLTAGCWRPSEAGAVVCVDLEADSELRWA